MTLREYILRWLYPSTTLTSALHGDRAARRALWCLGPTVEDLRAIDHARIARRREGACNGRGRVPDTSYWRTADEKKCSACNGVGSLAVP